MRIVNKSELDKWLFEHSALDGHLCVGLKGTIQAKEPNSEDPEEVNVAWIDTVTGERFDVIYGE